MLSSETVDGFRRLRFTTALAEECAQRGYRATRLSDVVARAGTARATFYQHFCNKDQAFIALLERVRDELLERVENACAESADEPPARIEAGLAAALNWIAGDPPGAHALLVGAPAGPDRAFEIQLDTFSRLAGMLRACAPEGASRPEAVEQFLVDGAASILRYLVVAGEAELAPTRLAEMSAFLAQPYLDGWAR